MGLFGKSTGTSKTETNADQIAREFVTAFNSRESIERLNELSEKLIDTAKMYWNKGDFDSYKKILSAAEETSYMYHGSNYPNDLVEELIRNSH